MSDREIEAFVVQLEASARIEEARFDWHSALDENESVKTELIANRTGLLVLAASLLRGAVGEEEAISAELNGFHAPHKERLFNTVRRREVWEDEPEPARLAPLWRDTLTTWGCVWLSFAVISVFIVGLVTVLRSIL